MIDRRGDADTLILHSVHLEGHDFSNRQLQGFDIGVGSHFVRCNFNGLRAKSWSTFGSGKQASTFEDCSFDRLHIKGGGAGRAVFVRCTFRNVRITDYRFTDASFVDCVISGQLRGVIFSARTAREDGITEGRNQFYGNDFSSARLNDVSFRCGIDVSAQRWPEDEDCFIVSNADAILRAAWAIVSAWPAVPDRSRAETKIEVLFDRVEEGQKDLVLSRKSVRDGLSPDFAEQLLGLLGG